METATDAEKLPPVRQFGRGLMCLNGHGVDKNEAAAARWFKLAADQGHPQAQCYLGVSAQNVVAVHLQLLRKWLLMPCYPALFPRICTAVGWESR